MGPETVGTLVIVGVIVALVALHLIAIAASLHKIGRTVESVLGGVKAISEQTRPVTQVVGGIAGDVAAIDDDLEGLLVLVAQAQAEATPPPPPPPPARAAVRSTRPVVREPEPEAEAEAEFDFEPAVASGGPSAMKQAVARARAGAGARR